MYKSHELVFIVLIKAKKLAWEIFVVPNNTESWLLQAINLFYIVVDEYPSTYPFWLCEGREAFLAELYAHGSL